MSRILVAEFDSLSSASAAFEGLTAAGVERKNIDTYPTLEAAAPREPQSGESVPGAETTLSTNGPLGHLQSIVAKLFGVGNPDDHVLSSSEPTEERTGKSPAFLSIRLASSGADVPAMTQLLTRAGAIRVAEHDV